MRWNGLKSFQTYIEFAKWSELYDKSKYSIVV